MRLDLWVMSFAAKVLAQAQLKGDRWPRSLVELGKKYFIVRPHISNALKVLEKTSGGANQCHVKAAYAQV